MNIRNSSKFSKFFMILILASSTCDASWLQNLLGPDLYRLVGAHQGWNGLSYEVELGNYYSSIPQSSICPYFYCNTGAAMGMIRSNTYSSVFGSGMITGGGYGTGLWYNNF